MAKSNFTVNLVKNCNKLADQFKLLVNNGMTNDEACNFLFEETNKHSNITLDKGGFYIALYIGMSIGVKEQKTA